MRIEERIRRGRWLDLLNNPKQVASLCNTEYELSLFKLKIVAEVHIFFSMAHLATLKAISLSNGLKGPTSRYETLNEGSNYLENAFKFLKAYKDTHFGEIADKNIQIVETIMVVLGFDPRHISYGGKNKCFIGGRQDALYYQLLHSESNKDVRLFLKIVEQDIEGAIELFLKSVSVKLKILCLEDLLDAIKNKGYGRVQKCIKKMSILEGNIDLKNTDGVPALHFAVNKGNTDIVQLLLASGAEATQTTDDGLTPLHIAVTKKHAGIVEILLEYVDINKLKAFINVNVRGGTTALHMAAKNESLDIVRALLSHGAAYNVKNDKGFTPLDYSKNANISDLLKLIDEMFQYAKTFQNDIFLKFKTVKTEECVSVLNAVDVQSGKTMFQIYMDQSEKTEDFRA
ncbi:hypothetical protein WA026_018925 [Henosepilachna vigintioctopunctata]|uniref:Ankyrin repeat protein n=1 Tax=Henosepilachna vigintioctopunctata TaxID=420089 RepID=A0AAW1UGB6_9CUCU